MVHLIKCQIKMVNLIKPLHHVHLFTRNFVYQHSDAILCIHISPRTLHHVHLFTRYFIYLHFCTFGLVELYGLVFGPKAGKRIPSNLGGHLATLGANVATFINILTSMF